jgi:hypothetical protein
MDLESEWEDAAERWAQDQPEEFGNEVMLEYLDGEKGYFIPGNYSGDWADSWPDEGEPNRAWGLVKFEKCTFEVTFAGDVDDSLKLEHVKLVSGEDPRKEKL